MDEEERVAALMAQTFNALFARYGVADIIFFDGEFGLTRFREYSDGGWLQGYHVEPVLYWGA